MTQNRAELLWTACDHSWSETSIYADDRHVCSLSIEDGATEDTQDALESEMAADVAFIVRACNSHAKLVEALNKYAGHQNDHEHLCEALKHDDYPCTCGWDDALQQLKENDNAE
jgi:hypothetical protein